MIKKYSLNKIYTATTALILTLILSLIPYKDEIDMEVDTVIENNNYVYLINDDYLVKVGVFIDKDNINDIINDKINLLIKGYNVFDSTINNDCIINSINVYEDKVYIDFSNFIISNYSIESLVFSLTDINGINDIYITIDGKDINIVNSKYNNPLNRNIGINKVYDINNLNNIDYTIINFIKEINNVKYNVPITKVSNDSSEKVNIIINELKSSVYSVDNLESYISNNLNVAHYEIKDNVMNIVFNDYLFEYNDNLIEEVKYVIGSSIIDNYDVDKVIFSTNDIYNIDVYEKQG